MLESLTAGAGSPVGLGATTATEQGYAQVLAEVLQVEQVPLDAHVFDDLGADSMVMARFCARVRKREDLPTASMKDVYQHPTLRRLGAALAPTVPVPVGSPVEGAFAQVLADVLQVDEVPLDAHVFDDLGADSMVMARFCARVRKRVDLPTASMKDVYRHPTLRGLAEALEVPAPAPAAPIAVEVAAQPAGSRQHVVCGTLQLLFFLGYAYLGASLAIGGYDRITAGTGLVDTYLRVVAVGSGAFVVMSVLPVLVKWVLVGRWRVQEIRLWSLAYVRFWIVKTLVRANPLVVFAGTPLYVLYLRSLGARIGRGVVILSPVVPVCTDLLTVGHGTVIRKDVALSCYRAHGNVLQTGPVTLGSDVLVSEATVLDIGTSMADGAQLGHRSSLHTGQSVPRGESWHGSPARRTHVDFRTVAPRRCTTTRRVGYSVLVLLKVLLVNLPVSIAGLALLIAVFPAVAHVQDPGKLAFTSWVFYVDALVGSLVLFLVVPVVGLLIALTVPRVLNRALEPDRVYPLFGWRYAVQRTIARTTNRQFWMTLFGDSSYVVPYLSAIGYDLSSAEQTGSNFGMGVKHENPYLVAVGRGTMVADELTVNNADFSSTSFRVARASIGAHCFLGNHIAYPAGGRTGDDCLLATKVMVPIDGPLREGVGLLGSPAFEIPRRVQRDATFDDLKRDGGLGRRLAAKNRYNLRSMGLLLLARWATMFGVTLILLAGGELHYTWGASAFAVAVLLSVAFGLGASVFVERAASEFRPLSPRFCSIYDPHFWWHEQYWKVAGSFGVLNGTPFKPMAWRALGMRMGRRVFDDGCRAPERSLVTVGDDCTLNAGSVIQCHSQEDGAFKSDRTTIGSGCTIGVGALVHYGVTVGDGVVIAADSFVMKGEDVPAGARWGGNPAGPLQDQPDGVPVLPRQRRGPQHALTVPRQRRRPQHALQDRW